MKYSQFVLLTFLFVTVSTTVKADTFLEITELNKSKTRLMVEKDRGTTLVTGQLVLLSDTCALEIVRTGETTAILSSEMCPERTRLYKGKKLRLRGRRPRVLVRSRSRDFNPSSGIKMASNGFFAGVNRGFFNTTASQDDPSIIAEYDFETIKHNFGITFGYGTMSPQELGIQVKGHFMTYDAPEENTDLKSAKFDFNLTFGLNYSLYFYAGVNTQKFIDKTYDPEMKLGYQAGVGINLAQNLDLNLSYQVINNRYFLVEPQNPESVDVETSGVQLALQIFI